MSADNYYVVRPDPSGYGWYALMGFASDDSEPEVDIDHDPWFATKDEAIDWALLQHSEYGLRA